ncbi:cobalamin biosynthesis protein CbiG [Mesorhizobium loti]|nr:cobalamin biosynthesis protein [Mesorhizobium loti]PLP60447.1 cobalamin biosynthesis protein CbiG [Mesorhizobium loti]
MIVAGIGCRRGVDAADVVAAVDAALRSHDLDRAALSALATTTFKQDEAAIFAAARQLGLEVIVVEGADGENAQDTLTRSDISLAVAGSSSVSESAALAAAGKDARLLGPRLITGAVTCAIAVSGASA